MLSRHANRAPPRVGLRTIGIVQTSVVGRGVLGELVSLVSARDGLPIEQSSRFRHAVLFLGHQSPPGGACS
jgi:hypothetical protein